MNNFGQLRMTGVVYFHGVSIGPLSKILAVNRAVTNVTIPNKRPRLLSHTKCLCGTWWEGVCSSRCLASLELRPCIDGPLKTLLKKDARRLKDWAKQLPPETTTWSVVEFGGQWVGSLMTEGFKTFYFQLLILWRLLDFMVLRTDTLSSRTNTEGLDF